MSLKSVIQQLRQLPYTEMKALSGEVAKGLDVDAANKGGKLPKVVREDLADVLSSLPQITNDELDNEQKWLSSFFNKKRVLSITTGNGVHGPWTVKCEGGVSITSATLRGALSEFLDAQAAYVALRK
jgi:hypothetical protein